MECASDNKVPGLPWKDQASALKAPNWQCFLPFPVRNELRPLQSWTSGIALWPQKEFPSHLCLRESNALQINYLKPFLCLFHTMRDSVPLALCAIILKLHETYVQSSLHPNQTHCLFLMPNHIIQSLRLLLANGCAWS